jgi:gluconolactonase
MAQDSTGHAPHLFHPWRTMNPIDASFVRGLRRLTICVFVLCFSAAVPSTPAAESVVAEGATLKKVAVDYSFTEGPAADRDGNVYFTDQPSDRIVRWDAATGELTDWLKPAGRANGLYFDPQGNLIACADDKNELWSIAPDKTVIVLVKDYQSKLLNGPNDVWVRPGGGLYFTDPLYKRSYWKRDPAMQQDGQHVYYLSADSKGLHRVATDLKQPNGIIGTPDGKTLYVADIGAARTYAYDIQADGSLTGKRLFCELGSDGMTIDREGNIYLTGRGVTVFGADGQERERITVPEPWTANVTFAGPDRKTLFITAGKAIYTLSMRVAGAQ